MKMHDGQDFVARANDIRKIIDALKIYGLIVGLHVNINKLDMLTNLLRDYIP